MRSTDLAPLARARGALAVLGLVGVALAPIAACGPGDSVATILPAFPGGGLLRDATPLSTASLELLDGFYRVEAGTELVENDVAVRASPNRLSFFSAKEATYLVTQGGCVDGGTRAVLEGYWRNPRSLEAGLVRVFVGPDDVAAALCSGATALPRAPRFDGSYGFDQNVPQRTLGFGSPVPLAPYKGGRYLGVGHRGACELPHECGASPNSIESLLLAQALGANFTELDVRLTKDNVPILLHEGAFSATNTTGRFCMGKTTDLTFAEVQAHCRMTLGERVPTLQAALDAALDKTTLEGVYVDTKDAAVIPVMMPIVRAVNARAKAIGRQFVVAVGMSKQEMRDEWNKLTPPPGDPPCIVEDDLDQAIALKCPVWGPTWTAGTHAEDLARAHEAGLKVVYWTVNHEDFQRKFLDAGADGLLSGRSGQAFFLYQQRAIRGSQP
jgi:glycerophosphoryl diester phosphodiesterase